MTVTERTDRSLGPLVRCTDLARTYGRGAAAVVAVHALTATVCAGELIAVTGAPMLLRGVAAHEATARADRALALVDAQTLSQRLPEELSGGQAQRVAVARTAASPPTNPAPPTHGGIAPSPGTGDS